MKSPQPDVQWEAYRRNQDPSKLGLIQESTQSVENEMKSEQLERLVRRLLDKPGSNLWEEDE